MSNVYFKEDPQKIAAAASLLLQQKNDITSGLSSIKTRSDRLKSFWESDGSVEYQRKAAQLDSSGKDIVNALDELIKKLQQVSGIYVSGEQAAKTAAQSLPTDGVFR
jgi:WXG100 family type VII secretion target